MKRTQALVGVNLGGWLVLERWMTPSLFKGTDAKGMYELILEPDGRERIERHYDTFITEEDFVWLAMQKIDIIRIPVGYWLLSGEDNFPASGKWLDWAFTMAKKYKLKILIDLHAVKGSQNGQDYNGPTSGEALWYRRAKYRQATVDVLEEIAKRYGKHPALWGIELLNEPKLGFPQLKLLHFYRMAYKRLRLHLRPGVYTVFSDAWLPRLLTGALWQKKPHPVAMDIHWYHFTSWLYKWQSMASYFHKITRRSHLIHLLSLPQPVIIGEWSGTVASEATRGVEIPTLRNMEREYIRLQMEAYSGALAWFYWSYKTDDPGIWNFRSLVESGVIVIK